MARPTTARKYGKNLKKSRPELLFAELPKSPVKLQADPDDKPISQLTEKLAAIAIEKTSEALPRKPVAKRATKSKGRERKATSKGDEPVGIAAPPAELPKSAESAAPRVSEEAEEPVKPVEPVESIEPSRSVPSGLTEPVPPVPSEPEELRVLAWDDVCPPGDKIDKIAEASYAEVYRVSNDRGTSIIKVIRLDSPIKAQTKTQERSGLVDEEPHAKDDLVGELRISEWLADIPGFVIYKERYIVKGKASKRLLETHQAFHRKMKRKDPDRLQFYPSPSRYLADTSFLVVELGDAGTALEDFDLVSTDQMWDIFFHVAIALARAEDLIRFEHRDLHEGNLCIRQASRPRPKPDSTSPRTFGYSGLEITILDYGLSRASDPTDPSAAAVAYDLEKDLGIFASTHAPQCRVYRQMRSYLLKGDRACLPPGAHATPYDAGVDGPVSWVPHRPYTNVLWLAYTYRHMVGRFGGDAAELRAFRRATRELWSHLDPDAPAHVLSFGSAADVVRYAVECGWVTEGQLVGGDDGLGRHEGSIVVEASVYGEVAAAAAQEEEEEEEGKGQQSMRRSPRRRRPTRSS